MKKQYNLQSRVIQILLQCKRPLSVKELVTKLDSMYHKTSIYRQLDRLFVEGRVHKIETGKETLYEIRQYDHAHFQCIRCEAVTCLTKNIEFFQEYYQELRDSHIIDITLDIKGICAQCQ